MPLIVQNRPVLGLPPSPIVQTAETFDGTDSFGAGWSVTGSRLLSLTWCRTRNCMICADGEPAAPAGAFMRGTLSRTTSLPSSLRKSTTTSARWAGPSRMSWRTTALGSRPLPVPTCTNGRPSESAKSYVVKGDVLSSRSRYRWVSTSRYGA